MCPRGVASRAAICAALTLAVGGTAVAALPAGPPGRLVQAGGKAGCLQYAGSQQCARPRSLRQPEPAAVSRDGRFVYIPGTRDSAIAIFARNRATGGLRQLRGRRGCISNFGVGGCARARSLVWPLGIALSPDGRNAYVVGAAQDALVVLARNPRTGGLRQLPGARGCLSRLARHGCARGRGLNDPIQVVVAPDGRRVYTATRRFPGTVGVFDRAPDGSLRQPPGADACVAEGGAVGCTAGHGLGAPWALRVAPDSRQVYVAALKSDAVAVLARTASGLAQQAGAAGCVAMTAADGCAVGRGLDAAAGVAVSRDGRSVYVGAANSNAVSVFARDPATGELSQLPGPAGCVSTDGKEGCTTGRAVNTSHGIVVSPDGRNVYAASELGDAISVFARSPLDGGLAQLPGRWGCLSVSGAGGCGLVRGLVTPIGLSASPDGRSIYATSESAMYGGVAILRRLP